MKKDKLIQEFESLKIDNAGSIFGGCNWHRTEYSHWEQTNGPSGEPGDYKMDEVKTYYADPDEGDTITNIHQLGPLPPTI